MAFKKYGCPASSHVRFITAEDADDDKNKEEKENHLSKELEIMNIEESSEAKEDNDK